MWIIVAAMAIAAAGEVVRDDGVVLRGAGQPALRVYHQPSPGPAVLYVHGSTFPAALSIDYRIDGRSWADDLRARGFDVWSFDFAGYGRSDRFAAMSLSSIERAQVPGQAGDAADQIERVAAHVRSMTGNRPLSIIAHSWGTIPAGQFAGRHPDWVDRLVLFGPVAQRGGNELDDSPMAPSHLVSAEDQWRSFGSRTPAAAPTVIDQKEFDPWAIAYLESDPSSASRDPRSVRVPSGPDVDFDAAWNGAFPYDPAIVTTPTMIVRGEWDVITRDSDAAWLKAALRNVPGGARDVKLVRGAHRMHLERNRQSLFDAVGDFLTEKRR